MPVTGDQWSWTLGAQQYHWFKQTLENSNAKYKFVFSHQMLGGITTSNHPGLERAMCAVVPRRRPILSGEARTQTAQRDLRLTGTPPTLARSPIHQLMVANGVSAYFHGHDHQYVYETRDGIVYQEVPSPSMAGSGFSGIYTEGDHGTYNTIKMLPSSGSPADHGHANGSDGGLRLLSSNTSGTVNYSYTIEPEYSGPTYTLTTAVSPSGGGTINPAAGTHTYDDGENVSVTATPNAGYTFTNWSGACSGSGACSVTMDGDRSVTAIFTALPKYSLTTAVNPPGGGAINPSAGDHTYNLGDVVTVTATPSSGYTFSSPGAATAPIPAPARSP